MHPIHTHTPQAWCGFSSVASRIQACYRSTLKSIWVSAMYKPLHNLWVLYIYIHIYIEPLHPLSLRSHLLWEAFPGHLSMVLHYPSLPITLLSPWHLSPCERTSPLINPFTCFLSFFSHQEHKGIVGFVHFCILGTQSRSWHIKNVPSKYLLNEKHTLN